MQYQRLSLRQSLAMTWWNKPRFSGYDGIICDGSIRSGKTIAMSVGFLMWAMTRFDGKNFAICGKTIESLRRNVTNNLPDWMSGIFTFREKRTENKIIVSAEGKSNTFYLFGGRDESSASLIQGITLAGVLLDEVALMPRSFVEQAVARCSVEGSKLWFNCNPEGPNHWFYLTWIQGAKERNILHLHFTMEDNCSLSDGIKTRYENLYSGVFYDRFIRGLWVIAEGLVYPQFADHPDRYLVKGSTSGMDGQFYVSIDYGTVNPCSMGLWCVQHDRAVRIKEIYYDSRRDGGQKTDEEHYAFLEKLTNGYYIRYVVIDPSAASFAECIRRHGKYMVYPADNDVLNGIRITSDLLAAGKVKIHASCKDSIREFGLYRWDEKANEDKVIKENDHAMDDIRYFCSTVLARQFRWADWRGVT